MIKYCLTCVWFDTFVWDILGAAYIIDDDSTLFDESHLRYD